MVVIEDIGARAEARRAKLVGLIQQDIDKVDNALDILDEELRFYEMALRRIIREQPESTGAEIAEAALHEFGMGDKQSG